MKLYLPHNILVLLAVAVAGASALYNLVLRESYASVLRYSFPAVEQPADTRAEPDTARIYPGDGREDGRDPAEAGDEAPVYVRFPLDLNTATVEQLKFIPQVGDVTAQRIVQYRQQLGGRYTHLEQLMDIAGVGEKTYERLWSYLIIGGDETAYEGETAVIDGVEFILVDE